MTQIYYHTEQSEKEVFNKLRKLLKLNEDFTPIENFSFLGDDYDIYLRKNKNWQKNNSLMKQFPEGYLYFRYILLFVLKDDLDDQIGIATIAKILNFLWENNIPAVSESSYDSKLPFGGGYNIEELPWPSCI